MTLNVDLLVLDSCSLTPKSRLLHKYSVSQSTIFHTRHFRPQNTNYQSDLLDWFLQTKNRLFVKFA